ncbi:protein brambleberry-like isoform X2 [Schistocerca serialis cubense]|nr:protein brambleberry-like isoform X2 [Schistocerca serialis cubense]XP_049944776.1 protein brambleberry-like isoform X2 [Schistocerca serialis cubense]XP_049944777.1 protein brambleberry-like isoform X2 [Schistocerca serialis cubense]XP_049944778.1 protein brambleberry-like isoform X2 [Schistocerca serialis cubense]XP_049944779.1 protein brambleberry-like isoform X2 [Schistocerca serialis cubense]
MSARLLFLLWLTLAAPECGGASILGWLLPSWAGGGGEADGSGSARPASASGVDVPEVHFETKSVEDKFIDAVQRYEGRVSDLDACQHKVVLKIQKSCSNLSEEDLAKLSVNLLNCQASVEGRQQFPCTDQMSIRDCTQRMDADMWNAYHLMNNRARSVCYAARQQQFRAAAEMTVDRLFEATRQQVSAMDSLKSEQERLGQLTEGTLERQEVLLQQQHGLRQFVGSNLRDLLREKQLIAAGHRELARMTEDVRHRLDAANEQLDSQTAEQRANHEQLLADLTTIQRQAAEVWAQVERSTREVLDYQRSAARQYRHSLERLRKINETVDYLLRLVENTRSELDTRLGWVTRLAGDAGDGVERLLCAGRHLLVLVGGALVAAFVGAPPACRVALAVLVPANIATVLQKGPGTALDVSAEVAVVGLVAVVQWAYSTYRARQKQLTLASGAPLSPPLFGGRHGTPAPARDAHLRYGRTPPQSGASLWGRSRSAVAARLTAVFRAVLRLVPSWLWPRANTLHLSPPKLTGAGSPTFPREGDGDRDRADPHNCADFSDDELAGDDDDGLFVKDPLRESTPVTHFSRALDESRSSSLSGSRESLHGPVSRAPLTTALRYRSPAYSPPTPSVSSRGGTPSSGSRRTCAAVTRTGLPCRNPAGALSPYCHRHAESDGVSVVDSPFARSR